MNELEYDKIYDRTKAIIGDQKLELLKHSHVVVVGLGGVGSYTVEALARVGVGKLTIIDKDIVEYSNINRQLIATTKTIGKPKAEVAKQRINEINPNIQVNHIYGNVQDVIFEHNIDYIVDAIDDIEAKVYLIKQAKKLNIKIICSMGTANKLDPIKFKIADISKTEVCPLAKKLRKRLKDENIHDVKVIFSTEESIKTDNNILGSLPYVTGTVGLSIAAFVISEILKN